MKSQTLTHPRSKVKKKFKDLKYSTSNTLWKRHGSTTECIRDLDFIKKAEELFLGYFWPLLKWTTFFGVVGSFVKIGLNSKPNHIKFVQSVDTRGKSSSIEQCLGIRNSNKNILWTIFNCNTLSDLCYLALS